MKCVKIAGVKNLETSEIDMPKSVDGSVVLKVKACGICGSDIHYYDIGYPSGLVMGHEFCGEVVDPGSRSDLSVGDTITGLPISPCGSCPACKTGNPQYCVHTWEKAVGLSLTNPGGYAEYTSCRPDLVKKLPECMTYNEGAMVEPTAVSLHAINLADVKVGDKVLVIGSGIIGLMACEAAKMEGASYIGVLETNMKRAKKSVDLGPADEIFDAREEGIVEKLKEKTNGGFDIVIECCGNSAAVSEAIGCVRPNGTIVLVGVSLDKVTIPTTSVVLGEVVIKGSIGYTEKDFDNTIDLIASKKIDVLKYVDDVVPLEKANESYKRLTSGEDDAVKIIFNPEMNL